MYAEVVWVLVSSGTQVQPQTILDPDYFPDYSSVSYDYGYNQTQQVEEKPSSTNFTWLYFYLHVLIRIFCPLFIRYVLDGLLQWIFLMFSSKHSITFENTYLQIC